MRFTPTNNGTAPAPGARGSAIAVTSVPTHSSSALPGRTAVPAALLAAWIAVVIAVAAAGGFVASGPALPTVVAVAVPVGGFAVAYRTIPAVRARIAGLDLTAVLALQTWRVVGAAFLFGWATGDLPAGFAIPAGVGDIATGVAAVPVTLAAARGDLTRRALFGFTALGIGDFLVAIVTGVALQPVALETLPWALFPTLAVPGFAVLHLVAVLLFARRDASSIAGVRADAPQTRRT